MIIVHHLNNSRSQRILWMLEELGLAYEIVAHQRDATTRLAPEALKAVHPLGKSPVIIDAGLAIAESGAILEYLVARYGEGRFAPAPASPDWVSYLQWLHFAEGSAMTPLLLALYVGRLGEAGKPLWPRIEGEIANHIGYIDQALAGRDYLVGDSLTAADVQVAFVLEAASASGALKSYPNAETYLRDLQDRPAYQRALSRGGPYDLGGNRR